jgi:hypothetical protein
MKNIHILPTSQPSRLHLAYNKNYYLSIEPFVQLDTKNYKSFNIYITSDEEIKVNDAVIDLETNDIFISKGKMLCNDFIKKIILTTDQDLIKDGVQAIDDTFLEWFVKNPSCESVEVFKDFFQVNQNNPTIKIPQNASEMMLTTNDDIIQSIPPDDEFSEWDVTLMDGLENEPPYNLTDDCYNINGDLV